MKKDDLVHASVIAVGAAATGFALAFLLKFGIKQEPLFALIGALIGAATTIGGAAWLADRNRVVERDAEVALLIRVLRNFLRNALDTQKVEPLPGMPWLEGYRPRLRGLSDAAGNVHAITGEALTHGKALSFLHRAAIRRVQFAINEYLGFWLDANAEDELHPMDERNFPQLTASIIHECKVAIAELNGAIPFANEV